MDAHLLPAQVRLAAALAAGSGHIGCLRVGRGREEAAHTEEGSTEGMGMTAVQGAQGNL